MAQQAEKRYWMEVTYKNNDGQSRKVKGIFISMGAQNDLPKIWKNGNNLSELKLIVENGDTVVLDGEILRQSQIVMSEVTKGQLS